MSYKKEKIHSLNGLNFENITTPKLQQHSKDVLTNGIHGLCFSPYEEGQQPGDQLSEEQIRRRLQIIKPYTNWVRSFSCTEGNELIPMIAKELGFKTLVGAWLSDDHLTNDKEIESLEKLCQQGYVDVASVGNEVLYRDELTEKELLVYIDKVKANVKNTPIGYVDAYYEFVNRPKLSEACDVILANCYPFWEACHLDYSLLYMKEMYKQAIDAGKGKRVIITETGWPSQGSSLGASHPSYENALKYFINAQTWSKEDDIEMFYFSSFDESWKVKAEGDVGAYWGLWDTEEKLKF